MKPGIEYRAARREIAKATARGLMHKLRKVWPDPSTGHYSASFKPGKYFPHQGKQEMARRTSQVVS